MTVTGAGARRRTLFLLGAVAGAGVLTAVLFVGVWTRYVQGLEPDYFRAQGIAWGLDFQAEIERVAQEFLQDSSHADVSAWEETFPRYFRDALEARLQRDPHRRPTELTLLAATASGEVQPAVTVPLGRRVRRPSPEKYVADPESGLLVAVEPADPFTVVWVEGPVRAPAPMGPSSWRFRCLLEFQPFHLSAERGVEYAVLLVLVYLALLWALLVAVYRVGRREEALALEAKEKAIRLRAIGSVAEAIAHEVRNPLNGISLVLQYLERLPEKTGRHPAREDFQKVHVELGKIRKVIDNFVSFAKLRDLELASFDVVEALDEAVALLLSRIEDLGVTVEKTVSGDTLVTGDRPKLVQVLKSVVENALEAMAEGESGEGVLTLTVAGKKDAVRVAVRDTGETPGEGILESMFDPYFTTRTSAMGLGLTLARTVVESHGGRIEASAPEGGGCLVVITLPKRF